MLGVSILIFVVFSFIEIFTFIKLKNRNQAKIVKTAITSYIIFSLLWLAVQWHLLAVNEYILILCMISLAGHHYIGFYWDFYMRSKTVDRYLHAFGTFSFALLFYRLLQNFVLTGGSKAYQAIFVFTTGVALGALFETFEYAQDAKNGTHHQHGLKDTNFDVIFNMIGSLGAAIFAYFYLVV